MESYLADPYILRQETDRADSDICIGYIGIHDLDDDGLKPHLSRFLLFSSRLTPRWVFSSNVCPCRHGIHFPRYLPYTHMGQDGEGNF